MQYSNYNNNLQFENVLQTGLMSRFSTGNPLIDPIIHMFMYSLIGILVLNLKNIFDFANIKYYFGYFISPVYERIIKLFKRDSNTIDKQVRIDYISDNRKVNNLYKAVDWYLSTKCNQDLIKETPLQMTFEDDLDTAKVGSKISKKIFQNKYKSLQFKEHEIFYLLNKNLITVYADKERKRENFSIILSTKMSKDAKNDILEEFCESCLNEYIRNLRPSAWTQKIFINNRQGEWKSQESNNKRNIFTIVLKEGKLNEIGKDVSSFLDSKDWYHDRDIPYTRGYLFHGPPGTGKTSLIKGLSTFTKRHMHYLMLNNIQDDNQLLDLLSGIKYNETILIIEDIDCMTKIIEDRKKKEAKNKDKEKIDDIDKLVEDKIKEKLNGTSDSTENKLTLSGLLNAIDGIFNNDGRIMIMTTNHPEILDDALIRPGRIDRKILFDYCDHYQIVNIYKMMYYEVSKIKNEDILKLEDKTNNIYKNKNTLDDSTINKLKQIEEYKYSPAEITSLFLRYRDKPMEALDNIHELNDNKFVVNDRKFFGKEIENLIKFVPKQVQSNKFNSFESMGSMGYSNPSGSYSSTNITNNSGNNLY